MNRAVGVKFEMDGGENGLPVSNGEGESSKMVPVDIEMRGDEEYSEVTKHTITDEESTATHSKPISGWTDRLVPTLRVLLPF